MPANERSAANERSVRASRRGVLSALAGTGVASVLASASSSTAFADATAGSTGGVSLGTFESDLDGWEAVDDVHLSRVRRRDRPVAVTEGEYGLDASVEGGANPAVARPVGGVDLVGHPHFVADVAPGRVAGTDAPVDFRFRLYRPALDGASALELVAASDPVTVRQATPGRVYWDASGVDAGLLDAVSRLEIGWRPADAGSSGATYTGGVVLDAIRATASVDPVGSARLAATMRDLQFDHGAYVRTEVTAESASGEEGEFAFADGATEPYRFEVLADDRFRLAVAGTEIRLGGGWS